MNKLIIYDWDPPSHIWIDYLWLRPPKSHLNQLCIRLGPTKSNHIWTNYVVGEGVSSRDRKRKNKKIGSNLYAHSLVQTLAPNTHDGALSCKKTQTRKRTMPQTLFEAAPCEHSRHAVVLLTGFSSWTRICSAIFLEHHRNQKPPNTSYANIFQLWCFVFENTFSFFVCVLFSLCCVFCKLILQFCSTVFGISLPWPSQSSQEPSSHVPHGPHSSWCFLNPDFSLLWHIELFLKNKQRNTTDQIKMPPSLTRG